MNKQQKKLVEEFDSKIKKGIKFLDKKLGRSKWAKRIDLESLNLHNPYTCMIGEVMGNYRSGRIKLGKSNSEMEDMGFYTSNISDYPLLTRLWIGALYKIGIKG